MNIQIRFDAELDEIIVDHVCIDQWHLKLVFQAELEQPMCPIQGIYIHFVNVIADVRYEPADPSVGAPGGWYLNEVKVFPAKHIDIDKNEVRELVEQWVKDNQSMFDEEAGRED